MRRDRRARLEALQTGDGRRLPPHLEAPGLSRTPIGSNCCSSRSRQWRPSETRVARRRTDQSVGPAADVAEVSVALGRSSLRSSGPEGLSRHFDNRRLGSPLTPALPRRLGQSGSVNREQGISQSGNRRLRTAMIQLAWLWLRHQPRSALTLWFNDRMERSGGRRRKTTIVALARKLLVSALEICERWGRDRRLHD